MPKLKVVPLASKSDSSFSWSPAQCMETFLSDIKAGNSVPSKMLIVWFSLNPDGSQRLHTWRAQVSQAEEIALLEVAKLSAMEDWRK